MDNELQSNLEKRIDALQKKLESNESVAQETENISLISKFSIWTTGTVIAIIFIAIGLIWY